MMSQTIKILCFTFCALYCTSAVYSQTDSVTVIANWKMGEKRQYVEKHSKKHWENDVLIEESESSLLVSFEIIDSSINGYIVAYKIDSFAVAPQLEVEGLNTHVNKLFSQLVYKLRTDEYGEFIALENWEEIRQRTMELIKLHLIASDDGQAPSDLEAKTRSLLLQLMESKEQLESILYKHVLFLYSVYGYQYPLDEVINYQDTLPNPYGGEPLAADGEVLFFTDSLNRIGYQYQQRIDEEDGKRFILELLETMIDGMELSYEEQKKKKQELFVELYKFRYDIQDDSFLIFEKETGWVAEGEHKRVLIMKDSDNHTVKEETRNFQLVEQ